MKKVFLFIAFVLLAGGVIFFLVSFQDGPRQLLSPLSSSLPKEKSFEKYSFENLREQEYQGKEFKQERVIKEEEKYTSWLFSYLSDGKKVTGMMNLPKLEGPFPVVVMIRGHVDEEVYFTGAGTKKAAGVLAENGFLTLAPDFLGFGGSDTSSADILEARFVRPVTVLNLLSLIKNLEWADPEKVFLWGHSNGGQIALSVLEISQKPIPTTLWAPLTLGFPESILTFIGDPPSGEARKDDQGQKVKKAIDDFLLGYNPRHYSIDYYLVDIQAPLQVHQGLADYLIKKEWTDSFVEEIKGLGKEIRYYQYPQSDHNLKQNWDLVVERDLQFFQRSRIEVTQS